MPSINVKIFDEEKDVLEQIVKKNNGQTITLKELAKQAEQNPNRCRFIMEALIEEERVRKVPTKKYNAKFVRYKYEVIDDAKSNSDC